MEFSEIQISITAVFLLLAVAIVVLCNLLRSKRRSRRATNVIGLNKTWQAFEPSADPVALAPEIAALAAAGMNEENSEWRKIDQPGDSGIPTKSEDHTSAGECKAAQLPPPIIDEWLFDLLVSGRSLDSPSAEISSERALVPAVKTCFEVAPRPSQFAGSRGLIDGSILDRVLGTGRSFTGVVVSICINGEESGPYGAGLLEWVSSFIAGLVGENDFACRTGQEEFLIVCPGVQGAQAQRRLNEISEGLWEFQLRGIGSYAILFSWGGIRVQNQPLAEAIAAASERMRLTKRGRTLIYSDSVNPRRQVV